MERQEFIINQSEYTHGPNLVAMLMGQLAHVELSYVVDSELLFWNTAFGNDGFAITANGRRQEGTIRFKDKHIRIPAYNVIPVYESTEFERKLKPRAIMHIDRFLVCEAQGLTPEELAMDLYRDHKHMLSDMSGYYPTMNAISPISLYPFGKTVFTPTDAELKKLFELQHRTIHWK